MARRVVRSLHYQPERNTSWRFGPLPIRIEGLWKNVIFLTRARPRSPQRSHVFIAANRRRTKSAGWSARRKGACVAAPAKTSASGLLKLARTCCGATTWCSAKIQSAGSGLIFRGCNRSYFLARSDPRPHSYLAVIQVAINQCRRLKPTEQPWKTMPVKQSAEIESGPCAQP